MYAEYWILFLFILLINKQQNFIANTLTITYNEAISYKNDLISETKSCKYFES